MTILTTSQFINTLPWIVLCLSIIAAVGTLSMTIPQFIKVVKTKHTESLSSHSLLISSISGYLWALIGIINIIYLNATLVNDPILIQKINPWVVGLPVAIANLIFGTFSIIMFFIKIANEKGNKKTGK